MLYSDKTHEYLLNFNKAINVEYKSLFFLLIHPDYVPCIGGRIPMPGGGPIMWPIIGGGRMPIMGGIGPCGPIIIGGIPGGIIPCRGGGPPSWFGGGMATPPTLGGGAANGFCAILPALNAAVVASIRCCACSSIHFW